MVVTVTSDEEGGADLSWQADEKEEELPAFFPFSFTASFTTVHCGHTGTCCLLHDLCFV